LSIDIGRNHTAVFFRDLNDVPRFGENQLASTTAGKMFESGRFKFWRKLALKEIGEVVG